MSTVLVTGGSGFIGAHCILQLLDAGHQVRTTVRDLRRESDVLAMLKVGGIEPGNRLNVVAADLERDAGWDVAAAGCDYVLHVASPFPMTMPEHEDDLIIPAREGALRLLRAARDAGVNDIGSSGQRADDSSRNGLLDSDSNNDNSRSGWDTASNDDDHDDMDDSDDFDDGDSDTV